MHLAILFESAHASQQVPPPSMSGFHPFLCSSASKVSALTMRESSKVLHDYKNVVLQQCEVDGSIVVDASYDINPQFRGILVCVENPPQYTVSILNNAL